MQSEQWNNISVVGFLSGGAEPGRCTWPRSYLVFPGNQATRVNVAGELRRWAGTAEAEMGLVIFDLDGTLTPQRSSSTSAFAREFCEGVWDRCRELSAVGHTLAIASNQGGIGKGLSVADVEAQLGWVCKELGMAAARFACEPARKKPGPTMLLELMDQFQATANETWMVGDSLDDERAATAAGVRFVHVTAFVAGGLG